MRIQNYTGGPDDIIMMVHVCVWPLSVCLSVCVCMWHVYGQSCHTYNLLVHVHVWGNPNWELRSCTCLHHRYSDDTTLASKWDRPLLDGDTVCVWSCHTYNSLVHVCGKSKRAKKLYIYIGYTIKRRGIRDLYHCGNWIFRRHEHIAQGRLIRFPRWSKSDCFIV